MTRILPDDIDVGSEDKFTSFFDSFRVFQPSSARANIRSNQAISLGKGPLNSKFINRLPRLNSSRSLNEDIPIVKAKEINLSKEETPNSLLFLEKSLLG